MSKKCKEMLIRCYEQVLTRRHKYNQEILRGEECYICAITALYMAGNFKRRFSTYCGLFTLFQLTTACVYAQVESGRVVGTIRDSSGAVVAGANVTVNETATSVEHQVSTGSDGTYVVTELKPGTYTLHVEHEGFQKAVQAPFKLDVNQVVRVDITLVVGAVSQQIEVSAAEPLVETQTSSIGQVIDEERVDALPLNGRDFVQLAYLTPGVNAGPSGIVQQGSIPENERGNGAIQANGLTATNNNFLLNGFDNNEQQIGFEVIQPSIDAIQEFKVQTNSFGADIGRGGAVVNVVLKSGTNRFHGNLFEFLRNSAFDAKNYFDSPTLPIPPFKQNQFGGTSWWPDHQEQNVLLCRLSRDPHTASSDRYFDCAVTLRSGAGISRIYLRASTTSTGYDTGQIFDPFTYNPATNARQPFRGKRYSCLSTGSCSAEDRQSVPGA